MGKYFGTDGFRGRVGKSLLPSQAIKIGSFFGEKAKVKKVIIGKDSRLSSDLLEAALIVGLLSSGVDSYRIGVIPTPALSFFMHQGFDYGIMISASHNPFYDNGIKIFDITGRKIDEELERQIEEYIDCQEFNCKQEEKIGRVIEYDAQINCYLNFLQDSASIKSIPFSLIVDTANGSNYKLANLLLARLNINYQCINDSPNGLNINHGCGSTFLEANRNKYQKDDFVIAFDGDGDRMLCLYQNNLLSGDHILYLLAKYLKSKGQLKGNKVVTTIMANTGLLVALKRQGIDVILTDVGDKYVQKALESNSLNLGGEQSGHIILADKATTGDGMLVMMKLLEIVSEISLQESLSDLSIFPQYLENVIVNNKVKIMNNEKFIAEIIKDNEFLGDKGRILIRSSGTEELIRIMVECEDKSICYRLIEKYRSKIINLDNIVTNQK